MTDEMLAVADATRRESGLTNVEFRRGEIERIPLPHASVDVIVSDCDPAAARGTPDEQRQAFERTADVIAARIGEWLARRP